MNLLKMGFRSLFPREYSLVEQVLYLLKELCDILPPVVDSMRLIRCQLQYLESRLGNVIEQLPESVTNDTHR